MTFPNLFVFFIFFFTFHLFLIIFCDSKCPKSLPCQNLSLEYPFTSFGRPECGLIRIDCDSSSPPKLQRGDRGTQYDVMNADSSSHKLTVRDTTLQRQLSNRNCSSFITTPLPVSPYITFMVSPNLTLFKCDGPVIVGDRFVDYENYTACQDFTVYYRNPGDGNLTRDNGLLPPPGCSLIQVPVNASGNWSHDLFNLLTYEFSVEWLVSEMEQGRSKKKVIILAAGVSAATLIVIVSSILVVFFRENLLKTLNFQKAYAEKQVDFELLLKNHGSLASKLYKYSDLKKITNSFAENLGEGGYGIVYKGKLKDGHLVAVKILKESKGNGQDFINEVLSVSRTSHVNVVAFLGFCVEGSKRALIYEFMPNGSLEKFIPNTSSEPKFSLGVEQLFKIVVGVARGLEYLHQGCNMRILHFDIKPHNILLDKDFKPKISDFGLSKLCPNRSSIVSMQVARGTVGYIAPEVFSRNFGEVSHKSDVYSYGMMVLEMVLGKQNKIDPQGGRSSEIYFSDWIYKNLEQNTVENGVFDNNVLQEHEWKLVKRRLMIIGLWCIQTDPMNRPSISQVIEMLETKLECLQLPPRPYLFSSPRLPLIYSSSGSKSLL